ncbi:MAG: monofunctional biosynthetic peptidoglycan transglycosylase [bacterium]|nr:monofunctional biosynthetic peptidoglycan transglycosylase [bacterium]
MMGRNRRTRRRGCLLLATVTLAVAGLWAGFKAATWPDVASLASANPQTTAFIERHKATRRAAGESDTLAWRWAPYDKISPHLKRAVLVGEDIGFFDHQGFAVEEIKIALSEMLEEGKPLRGASTISQQLAKNLWLSPSRNPLRKVEEAILTRQLEAHLEKRRILELYLNVVELGPGIYGAEAAARHYFGKSAAALHEDEAAELAAALPKPSSWHPGSRSRAYRYRVDLIRERMAKARFLVQLI